MSLEFDQLLLQSQSILAEDARPDVRLKKVCKLLKESVSYYHWVGFYIAEPARRELVLGPYAGTPTDHIRIAYGLGICGQVANREQTFVVQDVSKEANYISCSMHVRSEIVVPVLREGRVVAEIDVDSHLLAAFTPADRAFLERLAERAEPLIVFEA